MTDREEEKNKKIPEDSPIGGLIKAHLEYDMKQRKERDTND